VAETSVRRDEARAALRRRATGSGPAAAPAERAPVAQTGRALGPRALATRRRIMAATAALLEEQSVLDLPVVDIARRAGASPATFYHYFKDVEEVALVLAEEAGAEMPAVVERLAGPFDGADGLARARGVVDLFFDHWDAHHAVLTLRNMASERGDRRFQRVRQQGIGPVLDALAARIREGQERGSVARGLHPFAAAVAMAAILERLAAHHRDMGFLGIGRDELREGCARILLQTLTGKPAID
jgi:AcrR family transcriptional regulator